MQSHSMREDGLADYIFEDSRLCRIKFTQSSTLRILDVMTSVNSPACLLARNHFYRNLPPSVEQIKPALNRQNDSVGHKQRQVSLWVTIATPTGGTVTKELSVNIDLGSSFHLRTSKPSSPAGRSVK